MSLARRVVLPAARAFAVCFPLTLIVALSSPRADVVLNTGAPEPGQQGGSQGGWSSTADLPVLGLGGLLTDPRTGEVPNLSDTVAAVPPSAAAPDAGSFGAAAPFGIASVTTLTSSGIPTRAYQAYLKAQGLMAAERASCRIPWSLVAGIGRVESNHGRFGGAGFAADGRVVPPILGILLDGSRSGTAAISDSDGGAYDGNARWDRAVGPMQFLPGTWKAYGGDGDGDGRRDPQQIDDAAYGTARYLCSTGGDLTTTSGRYAAVFRYNHSDSYVRLVLSLAATYASGVPTTVPNTVPPGGHEGSDGPSGSPGGTPPGMGDGLPKPRPTITVTTTTTTTTTVTTTTTPTPTPTGTTVTPTPTDTTLTPTPTDTCIMTPDPTAPAVTPTVPPGCPTPTVDPVPVPTSPTTPV